MSEERLTGLALMHLHHDLNIDIDDICTTFVIKAQEEDSKGASLTSRIHLHGKGLGN